MKEKDANDKAVERKDYRPMPSKGMPVHRKMDGNKVELGFERSARGGKRD